MHIATIVCIGLFFTTEAHAAEPKNIFVSTDHGISIETPFSPNETEIPSQQIAFFFLPQSEGFAANVDIEKKKFSDSIIAFDQLFVRNLQQFGLTIVKHTLDGEYLIYEYKGDMYDKHLHWYVKAIKSGEYVYIATAAGLNKQWDQQKTTLIKSVDSFVVKQ